MSLSSSTANCQARQAVSELGKFKSQAPAASKHSEICVSFGGKSSFKLSLKTPNNISLRRSSVASDKERELAQSMSGMVTDENVPEGHKGLHSFLYADGGAEAHDAADSVYRVRQGEDDGETQVPVMIYLEARDAEKPLGVYAVYNQESELQYIGYSRNVVLALKGHVAKLGNEKCSSVRVMVFANRAMATRSNMEAEVESWLREAGSPPPGNDSQASDWSDSLSGANASMSPAELAEYEEKKLKMRKAMGENLYDAVEGETLDMATRRLQFLNAVEGDDWSSVIDGQTQSTLDVGVTPEAPVPGRPAPPATLSNPQYLHSPFSQPGVSVGEEAEEQMELTLENADKALEEVRPYMIADGGNVEVVGVEDGIVALRLQGACGTCPSSTATMQMGIEKALEKQFGSALKGVVQVDKIDISASVFAVNAHLDVLRPAITNYGGSVEVLKVKDGICEVKYIGPAPIAMGITAAIKDKFPDVHEVTMHE